MPLPSSVCPLDKLATPGGLGRSAQKGLGPIGRHRQTRQRQPAAVQSGHALGRTLHRTGMPLPAAVESSEADRQRFRKAVTRWRSCTAAKRSIARLLVRLRGRRPRVHAWRESVACGQARLHLTINLLGRHTPAELYRRQTELTVLASGLGLAVRREARSLVVRDSAACNQITARLTTVCALGQGSRTKARNLLPDRLRSTRERP
jgi:hypothetical protein